MQVVSGGQSLWIYTLLLTSLQFWGRCHRCFLNTLILLLQLKDIQYVYTRNILYVKYVPICWDKKEVKTGEIAIKFIIINTNNSVCCKFVKYLSNSQQFHVTFGFAHQLQSPVW